MQCLTCFKAIYPDREVVFFKHPSNCTEPCAYTRIFKKSGIVKEVVKNYCVVKEPVKAVYYKDVCKILDNAMEGNLEHLILLGPPGTGKSLLMNMLEMVFPGNVIRYYPEENIIKYVGDTEKRFKGILDRCKALKPCLLLIDEADRIIASREEGSSSDAYGEVGANLTRILLRFLQETSRDNIYVVASTNYPLTRIDNAVFRAGRMKPVYFPPADINTIELLASLYGKKLDKEEAVSLLNRAVSHSNIVHYLTTGELREYTISSYAKVMYIDSFKPRVKIRKPYKLIVAEDMPQALYLGVLVANSLSNKPAIVLTDPNGIRDLVFLAKTSGMPLVIPYYRFHEDDIYRLLASDASTIFAGNEWDLNLYRINFSSLYNILETTKKNIARALECDRIDNLSVCFSGIIFS